MRIKSNISALNAQIALNINESKMAKNLEKLASGFRINRSGDDAAGLAISEQMRSAIARMDQAELNARDGVGLLRTGEGAMQEIHAMLIQLNGLAIQSANGVYTDEDHRELMQEEADRISEEIDRIAKATRFNYVGLFQDEGPEDGAIMVTSSSGQVAATKAASRNVTYTNTGQVQVQTVDVKREFRTVAAGFGSGQSSEEKIVNTSQLPGLEKAAPEAKAEPVMVAAGPMDAGGDTMTNSVADAAVDAAMRTVDPTADAAVDAAMRTVGAAADPAVDAAIRMVGTVKNTMDATDFAKAAPVPTAALSPGNGPIVFQIGPNGSDTMSIPKFYLSKKALGLDELKISNQVDASKSIDKIDQMINRVSQIRGAYGAAENALEHAINSVNINKENMIAAESRIRDTDMASELTGYTKNNIVLQAAQSMLAQANALPEVTLQLLR